MRKTALWIALGGLLISTLTVSCSEDPDAAKRRYFQEGERYLSQQKYQEAIIQFRNAIQVDPRFGDARYRLARAYEAVNDPVNALREYVRAADLLPDNEEAQLRAGSMLAFAGRYEDAKTRAQTLLAKNPRNLDAQILRANATAGLKDLDGAVTEIEEAIRLDPNQERSYVSLGRLEGARGRQSEAEEAFKKAVEIAPASVDAHVALANYYLSVGRRTETEEELKRALALNPKHLLANRALAMFYQATDRAPEAEPYLKTLIDVSSDPTYRFALADYYVRTQRHADAVGVLQQAAADPKVYVAAQVRLAGVKYISKEIAAAHAELDEALKREPNHAPALTLKTRFLLQEHKLDEALARGKAAVSADARSWEAQHVLGLVYVAHKQLDQAIDAFREATNLNPRAFASQTQLARIYLARGQIDLALEAAEVAVKHPAPEVEARLILVRLLIAKGITDRAEAELKTLEQQYPQLPVVPALVASLRMRQNNRAAARRNFERTLALDPGSVEGITGLVTLDLDAGNAAAARARLDAAAAAAPREAAIHLLAARVHSLGGNDGRAEAALRKAMEVDPSNLSAYSTLGRLYLRQNKLEQARQEFDRIAGRDPKNVFAQTMVGIILELENKPAEAQKQYEHVLQLDPNAAVAANNLAWLYAERGGNLDLALQLAQTAKARLPERPEINDTLGWVYYKKGLVSLAIAPFQESVDRDPGNPLYHYHRGLAYAKLGDKPNARASLEQALKLNPTFSGATDARRVLAEMQG